MSLNFYNKESSTTELVVHVLNKSYSHFCILYSIVEI